MIAFTGPVRQVETAPTKAVTIEPAPHAVATTSTGGECPAEREHEDSGRDERADHFRVAQVAERRPDEHRAGNGPEEDERLPVQPAEGDADQPVHEKRAEYPRRQVRRRKPTARAHCEDDRHRARGRKDERDQAVYEVD